MFTQTEIWGFSGVRRERERKREGMEKKKEKEKFGGGKKNPRAKKRERDVELTYKKTTEYELNIYICRRYQASV